MKLEEFKNYKEILEATITNKAFRSRMMFEAIDDEIFAMKIIKYIDTLKGKITSDELNNIFNEIRKDTIAFYEKSKKAEIKKDKIFLTLRSLAYFYFLESMDEHSSFSEDIVTEIKQKYPNDYLSVIAKIDRVYLSIDTKEATQLDSNDLSISDDLLKKYIVLKQWQDKQHHFFDEEYGQYVEKLQQDYCNDDSMDSFSLEQFALRKRLFDSLSERKILDLDTCSILSELYIKKFVIKYIGGKMYGLSVLNSKGMKVPFTMVVPTDVEVSEDDLKIFKGKYSYYSVRSSADIEDGEKNSFAGIFDSYLNVYPKDLLVSIHKVKESVHNRRLKEYIRVNELEQPHMAVVIQSFKEPTYAGVWMGNSDDSGILEWVYGNGEKLVSGSSTPNSEIWKANKCDIPLKIGNQAIGSKMLEYQKKVGTHADFEWMILDDELVMLQFRAVTKKVLISDEYGKSEENELLGIPAAPGIISGEGRYLDSPGDEIVHNKILLAMMTDPNWLPHLMSSKGAVTAYGGFLCHTAIVCRELGIPCVTGIGEDSLDQLTNNCENIEVNGNRGSIKILSK